ncbi:hypothetical protein RchiOBHm_Chr1g0333941 [Rosa chinensis]|uniref:Uncharacterized protein n=1 Tax=Rosa chinensis TaxID=74649 RepID=A0A2P6SC57_ROSCH|nr:hypothetical protein RchiOBHm_Chr1g0333941 [Rosa chinensis]
MIGNEKRDPDGGMLYITYRYISTNFVIAIFDGDSHSPGDNGYLDMISLD